MLLKKVTIHKYKSFLTEQTYEVESQITRIVGKNESGKTALLEALAKSNYFEDNAEFKFSKDLDYPRGELTKVRNENPEAITCEYELSDEDIQKIEDDFESGIIQKQIFSVTSYYDNTRTTTGVSVDFSVFKDWLIKTFGVGDQGKEFINEADSFSNLEDTVTENSTLPGMKEIKTELEKIKDASGGWKNSLEGYIYRTFISPAIPKLWYFSDYFSLPCRINLNDFATGKPTGSLSSEEYKIAKALFELSGLQIDDIQSESNFETFKAQLEATSNSITDDMFEYWTTNQNLEIRFDIEHAANNVRYLNIRIYNSKHRVTLPLKNRSKGFLWFFSFLVWFSKIQGDKNSKYILLLDEPGLSLHASAQNDLLRFIDEKLAPEYQVIYTTHSPFMIDSLKLNEVRTVYDTQDPKIGSVVSDAVEEKDSDTLFPLQAALGYTIAQNLYVSPRNLLVEGISDLVYLNHFSTILKDMGKEGLSDDITIVPVGGADKIATFISLMRGNELSTVCLLDTFTNQSAEVRLKRMVEQKIIADKKILYYHSVIGQTFADIEDLFSKDEYLELYNGAFSTSIKITDLDVDKPIMSQLKRINGNKSFNHYSPANYMAKNIGTLTFSTETIERFEKLFALVNSKFDLS
ncbi:MAG: AAA family ATPase [Ruminococcus sp.]|jgi:predicted ATP-dependent endonuclease of OLD family|nr:MULTISPECIES: AAA family ATPase [Ruminococcus]MCI2113244.1 AAA family ATPase [Ruminococcus sp.]MDD6708650.1 AAA family ATPase [Ruminococcus sp.]PKD29130.1 putative ATP-binding protein involved in virulence [Ruminococcus bromii]